MTPKDAFHCTVHDYPGGCASLAPRMDMSPSLLRNKACPTNTTNVINLDDADRVMGLTGDFRILDALAMKHGHVCVKVQSAATASDMAILELVTHLWSANGEVGAEVHRTLADGIVEHHEIALVKAAAYRLYKATEAVIARLEGMAEK